MQAVLEASALAREEKIKELQEKARSELAAAQQETKDALAAKAAAEAGSTKAALTLEEHAAETEKLAAEVSAYEWARSLLVCVPLSACLCVCLCACVCVCVCVRARVHVRMRACLYVLAIASVGVLRACRRQVSILLFGRSSGLYTRVCEWPRHCHLWVGCECVLPTAPTPTRAARCRLQVVTLKAQVKSQKIVTAEAVNKVQALMMMQIQTPVKGECSTATPVCGSSISVTNHPPA